LASNFGPPVFQAKVGDILIEIDSRYFRPNEVGYLLGDARKAQVKLGWIPKTLFKKLVVMMIDSDLHELEELRDCREEIKKMKEFRRRQKQGPGITS
jgi:GDP-D-mannose dehydratase